MLLGFWMFDESADSKFVYASVSSKTLTISITGDNGYREYNYNGIWQNGTSTDTERFAELQGGNRDFGEGHQEAEACCEA
jgi:hypothetical protein